MKLPSMVTSVSVLVTLMCISAFFFFYIRKLMRVGVNCVGVFVSVCVRVCEFYISATAKVNF